MHVKCTKHLTANDVTKNINAIKTKLIINSGKNISVLKLHANVGLKLLDPAFIGILKANGMQAI